MITLLARLRPHQLKKLVPQFDDVLVLHCQVIEVLLEFLVQSLSTDKMLMKTLGGRPLVLRRLV